MTEPQPSRSIESERGPLAGRSFEDLYEIFSSTSNTGVDGLPHWPEEDQQKRFTGASGPVSLQRAMNFVAVLDRDGAFVNDWKALDFGCGWGRVASCMLTRGTPDQLDMCDAWPESLDLAKRGGFANRMFGVSDIVRTGEIARDTYDFCYALSVFTHLDRKSFETNLDQLVKSLKPGGKLYFTVRHPNFVTTMVSLGRVPADQTFEDGFWHWTYPHKANYGETAVEPQYVDGLERRYGNITYLGVPEHEQHLYRIVRG